MLTKAGANSPERGSDGGKQGGSGLPVSKAEEPWTRGKADKWYEKAEKSKSKDVRLTRSVNFVEDSEERGNWKAMEMYLDDVKKAVRRAGRKAKANA